ncbi:phospholipase [Pseudomonas atagonensis]|uniref:phospholipase n=1 Tax=Pseudomonas atagonensis TaxID=2609964 RepID=UPI0014095B80|nr:phospholipase [Pseudomonas atagonensis]
MSTTYSNTNWMATTPSIDSLSLSELSLPGTHNAGSDWKASYALLPGKHFLACQHDTFFEQLANGARALDLRLACMAKEDGIKKFRFRHNSFLSSRNLHDLLTHVQRFLGLYPDEFIILDFHELADSEGEFDYKRFNQHVINYLGPRIIPKQNAHLSLAELKRISPLQRVLVAATSHFQLDDKLFCRKITHQWDEASSTKASNLRNYIERVVSNPPDSYFPWSLSAATYSVPIGPVDLHEELNIWFDPQNSNWASRCNIINVDFIEESNIVSYCRTANLAKARR